MQTYPYQNLSLDDMPEEVWKEISDFDGYYEVSNLGRVKSLDRIVPHPRLYQQFVKGRVLKQNMNKNFNQKMQDEQTYMQVALSFDGKTRFFNVRRLVYSAFVKPLNHSEDGYYVLNANGDGCDNRLTNLTLATHQEKGKRVVERGRYEDRLTHADRSQWRENPAHAKRRMKVGQYSMSDALICVHASITEAHKATGIDPKGISHTARGLYKQWGGYKWQFIKETDNGSTI
jgi:hypothetical protein